MRQKESISGTAVIAPELFSDYAYDHLEIWPEIINCKINHVDHGIGTIVHFDKPANTEFIVKFDRKINGKFTHSYSILDMNYVRFDKLWLPIELYQLITGISDTFGSISVTNNEANFIVQKEGKQNTSRKTSEKPVNNGMPIVRIGVKIDSSSGKPVLHSGTTLDAGQALKVKCPYCAFSYDSKEIKSHINKAHPGEVKIKPEKANRLYVSLGIKKGKKAATISETIFYRCSECKAIVKKKNFIKHFEKLHPNTPIPLNPDLTDPPKTANTKKPSKSSFKRPFINRGRASGGKLLPTPVKTIRIGRRSGAVIRRKSY